MNNKDCKIALVIGCRPDCIKMLPLYSELKKRSQNPILISLGQHRELLESVLSEFSIVPDYSLDIMSENQTLSGITEKVLSKMTALLKEIAPERLVVHGDTSGAYAAALAAFYLKIPVAHVEAGLRTNDMNSPFPEEFNRRSIDFISDLHFAPSSEAKKALLSEGKPENTIFVCGNTAVDMLRSSLSEEYKDPFSISDENKLYAVITLHRRESFGNIFENMLEAIRILMETHSDLIAIFPVHPNPAIRTAIYDKLGKIPNLILCEAMSYKDFLNTEARAALILTDSGGVQEEAAALGVPAIIFRDKSERTVDENTGISIICGKRKDEIIRTATELIDSGKLHNGLHSLTDAFGDGKAAIRIADVLCGKTCSEWLSESEKGESK